MTTDDQGKKDESPADRLDDIKKEAKEDASGYYAQGDSKEKIDEAAEFGKPVEPVPAEREEMNMLKAVAFLGFGMAALAIIFILFFVRDLDTRVMGMDGTVSSLEEKMAPLQKRVDDGLNKVNEDISGLKSKVGNYERMMAVMELKRALVTVQEMSMGNSPDVKAKSGDVVAGIEALLVELGAGSPTKGMPAGIVSLEEAPAAPAVAEEPAPVAEEPAPAEETHAEEPAEEAAPAEEEAHVEEPAEEAAPAEEESSEGGDEGGDEGEDEEEEEDDE